MLFRLRRSQRIGESANATAMAPISGQAARTSLRSCVSAARTAMIRPPTISAYHATMNSVGPARLSARNITTADGEYGNVPSG